MLRFWHGRYFVFIKAERENPASHEAHRSGRDAAWPGRVRQGAHRFGTAGMEGGYPVDLNGKPQVIIAPGAEPHLRAV